MTQKTLKWVMVADLFLKSASIILIFASVAKIWSSFGSMTVLRAIDPLTGLPFGQLMQAVAAVELLVGIFCLLSKALKLRLFVVIGLVNDFVLYRFGLWAVGWHKPCNCLGSLSDALHISPYAADTAMKIILAYLVIGSYAILFWRWRQRESDSSWPANQ